MPSSLALVDPNFKMPQVWRTSIGFDYTIPGSSLIFTTDLMYTKDLQNVYQFGANRKPSGSTLNYLGDDREYYPNSASYTYNPALGGNAGSVLTNTTKGHSINLTTGFSLPARKGIFGSIFYSTTMASTTSDNPGSNASSAWGSSPNINNPNDLRLYSSSNALPHRIVGTLSYRVQYLKTLATTVSFYYNGSHQGRYSYTYNGDLNGDGINADLLYIPNNAADLKFAPIAASGNAPAFTVDQQIAAFNELINNDSYLRGRKGQYAERNGALLPWLHRVDARLLQDIFVNIGKQKIRFS